MEFAEALERFGFGERRDGRSESRLFLAQPNPYLTYTVHAYEDGTALFSWEFALGEYLLTKGIQFGSDETLNQFEFRLLIQSGPHTAEGASHGSHRDLRPPHEEQRA